MPGSKLIVYIGGAILVVAIITVVVIVIIGLFNTGISYIDYSVTQ